MALLQRWLKISLKKVCGHWSLGGLEAQGGTKIYPLSPSQVHFFGGAQVLALVHSQACPPVCPADEELWSFTLGLSSPCGGVLEGG